MLRYERPANSWTDAMPLGNGRLGAMVFGHPHREIIALNDATLWSGGPVEGNNPAAREALPLVREAVFAGRHDEAVALCKKMQGHYNQSYLPLGDLLLEFSGSANSADYSRQLNLATATARVGFVENGARFEREILASFPDQVLAIRLTADRPGDLSFTASLTSQLQHHLASHDTVTLALHGRAPSHVEPVYRGDIPGAVRYGEGGMRFAVHLHAEIADGTITCDGNRLALENCTEVILRLTAATSFTDFRRCPNRAGRDEVAASLADLNAARKHSWADLRARHMADYRNLFDRVRLDLIANSEAEALTIPERLARAAAGAPDPGLERLLFDFGRYLLIASSRPGGQPANLQGIWNDSIRPPWSSNWTININTQMNYWAAEPGNLAECHLPLLELVKDLAEKGRDTARINYRARGWVSHHNADLWRQTAPVGDFGDGDPMWANWCMSAAWLCQHLWEHYAFGGDAAFLRDQAWPVLRGAAEFALDWLVGGADGSLVTAPSTSPELAFKTPEGGTGTVTYGSTMDMQIFRDLFDHCLEAAHVLGINDGFTASVYAARSRLLPAKIGSRGNIQEWAQDFVETDVHHRHVSHLFGLHPGAQITPDDPALFRAAKRTLEIRGDDGTGWSLAWKICFWARLLDGDRAHRLIRALLRPVQAGSSSERYDGGGGVYASLLAAHPPFQIDANFGYVAGVIEMLLQSHRRDPQGRPILHLLPSLPSAWPTGSVTRLRARGGFEVDIRWADGRLAESAIRATRDGAARIFFGDMETTLQLRAGQNVRLDEHLQYHEP